MCGFVGIFDRRLESSDAFLREAVARMAAALTHRGPDDHGSWSEASAGVALGHRRLSIVDLSPLGKQPMRSASGRYVLAYNGEIYNHSSLRATLADQGCSFEGSSDTEVLLAAIERWGVADAVAQCNGMFAFAVWDRESRKLVLARDRVGIKPLYYGWTDGLFVVGSELKAFRELPSFSREINRDALALFLQHNYVPAPYTIYRHAFKLRPGHLLELDPTTDENVTSKPFWTLDEAVRAGKESPFAGNDREAVDALDQQLRSAVQLRMRADVPLGAFLSGGYDSSAVVALMQAQHPEPVKTFCIGFEESEYDESSYAASVANHLQTDHTTLVVSSRQAQEVIPDLPTIYDEPFADSSQIPTFLVSQLARTQVTVSLSGDGGDELFGGYARYAAAASIWHMLRRFPGPLRSSMAYIIRGLVAGGMPMPSKVKTLGRFLSAASPSELYARFHTHWKSPEQLVIGSQLPFTLADRADRAAERSPIDQMTYIDFDTYLPDDILVKLDRASMAVSLEARVPLLDHEVVEFAWSLPERFKVRDQEQKWLLRQLVNRYLPRDLIERPKVGFGVPIDSWLRGPLRDWAEALLDEHRLQSEGFFDPAPIRSKWHEHLQGDSDWHYYLWDVLMFEAWLERWK